MTSAEVVSNSMEGWSFCMESSSQSKFLPLFMHRTLRWWETWSNAGSSACFGSDCWTQGPYRSKACHDHSSIQLQGTFLASFLLFCVTQLRCFVDSVCTWDSLEASRLLWFVFVDIRAPLAHSEGSGCWSRGSGLVKGQVWHSGCVPGGRFGRMAGSLLVQQDIWFKNSTLICDMW